MKRKLKLEQKLDIAKRYRRGETSAKLAEEFGVSARHVRRIVNSETGSTKVRKVGSKHVTFRAEPHLIDGFLQVAKEAGYEERSGAFRSFLGLATGLVTAFPNDIVKFSEAVLTVNRLATNFHQITKRINHGRTQLTQEDRATIERVEEKVDALHKELKAMKRAFEDRRSYCRDRMAAELGEAARG